MSDIRFQVIDSPVGNLYLADNGVALVALVYERAWPVLSARLGSLREQPSALLDRCRICLEEYFSGQRKTFDFPLSVSGTAFQQKIWRTLETIPYGETRSYAELARLAGFPRAWRAAGSANAVNPVSIIVPCHRVIASDGSLAGYGGGQAAKRWLLQREGVI